LSSTDLVSPARETQVAWRVRRFLGNAGYTVRSEIPFLSKRIDLVGVSWETGRIVAVEAKVANWQRGLQQAIPYRLCSHESYLALSASCVKNVDRSVLRRFGIGLISVDGQARIDLASRASLLVHPAFLKAIRESVLARGRS